MRKNTSESVSKLFNLGMGQHHPRDEPGIMVPKMGAKPAPDSQKTYNRKRDNIMMQGYFEPGDDELDNPNKGIAQGKHRVDRGALPAMVLNVQQKL